jgi:hypothetical protein
LARFPIGKAVPISVYHFDDERSMRDNNVSGFNYRRRNTKTSSRSMLGRAIVSTPGSIRSSEAEHRSDRRRVRSGYLGTLTGDSLPVQLFKAEAMHGAAIGRAARITTFRKTFPRLRQPLSEGCLFLCLL